MEGRGYLESRLFLCHITSEFPRSLLIGSCQFPRKPISGNSVAENTSSRHLSE